jgi:hypothetical protein
VIRTLGQISYRNFVAGWFVWLLRLLLDFLRDCLLELESHPLRNTYCMSA